jgi:hypothetical protein
MVVFWLYLFFTTTPYRMDTKRNYRSKGERFFIDYLPDEVFSTLKKEEKKHYQRYRNHHKFVFDGNSRIKDINNQVKKLREEIKSINLNIKGNESHDGWELIMKESYSQLNHLTQKFEFYCSVGFRNRKSKTISNQSKFNKVEIRNQTDYKGKKLGVNPKLYVRIESIDKTHLKNIYVGSEENVRDMIIRVSGHNPSSTNIVKLRVREIYSSYVRYKIYHSSWGVFKGQTHSLKNVEEWCNMVGDTINQW